MAYKKIILYSIVLCISVSLAVQMGWITHTPILTTIIKGFPPMRTNTVICFLLLATSLLSILFNKFRYLSYISLLVLIGLNSLSLLEPLLSEVLGSYSTRIPGLTAVCFLLFAAALLFQSFHKVFIAQYLFHFVTLVAVFASFGYLFDIETMHRLAFLDSMALPSSILLIILSIAASLFNPTIGLTGLFTSTSIGGAMARRLFPAFALVVFSLSLLRITAHKYHLVSVELGIALFALSFIVCSLLLIWYTSVRLDQVEQEKKITERKLIEATQERLFKDVINNTSSAICIKNKAGEYILCNNAFASDFNKTPEEIIGKTAYDLFPLAVAQKIVANEPTVFETGSTQVYEAFAETPSGTHIMLTNKFPIYDTNNNITSIGVVATDVTRARLAELNLKTILDSAHVSIIKTDTNGLITDFNKGAEKLLGYSAEEMIGKHTPEIIHLAKEVEVRGKELSEQYGKQISGFDVFITPALYNEFESRRWTYVRKDGSTFPIQLVVTSIVNANQEVIGYLGIGTDITNEEMARTLQQELALKLQNRNTQLLNFAHITSHNLRSPVSNLVTLLDLLENAHTPEEKDILIAKFDTVTKRLASTLNDLIEALKIQEDISKEKEKLVFAKVFANVTEMLSVQIESTATKIHTTFVVAEIEYPKTYLESILLNIISNAIKYRSPKRDPIIYIETKYVDEDLVMTIKDNGLGIDLKKHGNKVFGFNKTFHRHPEAKGIGLFLTKTQIESMGGSIRVESEPDIGTTFIINFKK